MKIKIVRRQIFYSGYYYICYDIYHGFKAIFPFMTKWIKDKVGLSEEELSKCILLYITISGKVKIIIKEHKDNKK